jgi:hypothetical protein
VACCICIMVSRHHAIHNAVIRIIALRVGTLLLQYTMIHFTICLPIYNQVQAASVPYVSGRRVESNDLFTNSEYICLLHMFLILSSYHPIPCRCERQMHTKLTEVVPHYESGHAPLYQERPHLNSYLHIHTYIHTYIHT